MATNRISYTCRSMLRQRWRAGIEFSQRIRLLNAGVQLNPLELCWNKIADASRQFVVSVNHRLDIASELFGIQCHAITAHRIKRTVQISNFYRQFHNDSSVKNAIEKFGSGFWKSRKRSPLCALLGSAFFAWDKEGVSEDELTSCIDDAEHIQTLQNGGPRQDSNGNKQNGGPREDSNGNKQNGGSGEDENGNKQNCSGDDPSRENYLHDWETVIDRPHLKIWRQPVPGNSYLYQYKVFGTFYDITPQAFFCVQVDLEYRKQWDRLVVKLEPIDRDRMSGSEVIHWVTHFPYPMFDRDYVYVRRYKVDSENKAMVMSSRAVDHPDCPVDSNIVRVTTYDSQMVIKPHNHFDENGFDYVLTYYDDPQAAFPSFAYNWMASTGVPDFVEKLHSVAKDLQDQKRATSNRAEYDKTDSGATILNSSQIQQYS